MRAPSGPCPVLGAPKPSGIGARGRPGFFWGCSDPIAYAGQASEKAGSRVLRRPLLKLQTRPDSGTSDDHDHVEHTHQPRAWTGNPSLGAPGRHPPSARRRPPSSRNRRLHSLKFNFHDTTLLACTAALHASWVCLSRLTARAVSFVSCLNGRAKTGCLQSDLCRHPQLHLAQSRAAGYRRSFALPSFLPFCCFSHSTRACPATRELFPPSCSVCPLLRLPSSSSSSSSSTTTFLFPSR